MPCFLAWMEALLNDLSGGDLVVIDGTTRRHALDRAVAKAAIHTASAWANRHRVVRGQVTVDDQSNEMTAIPPRLTMLAFTGPTVTMDAMGCQQEISKMLTEQWS